MGVVENILGNKYTGHELGGDFGNMLGKIANKYGLKGKKRESFILDMREGLSEQEALNNTNYV